jgi:hypothetical protein
MPSSLVSKGGVAAWREGMEVRVACSERVSPACDSTHRYACGVRYELFLLNTHLPDLSRLAASPLIRLYHILCNLNVDMVSSIRRTQRVRSVCTE